MLLFSDEIKHDLGLRTAVIQIRRAGGPVPPWTASGPMIRVARRFFVFTARHVVDDAATARHDELSFLLSSRHPVRFRPVPVRVGRERRVDAGYLELSSDDAGTIQAQNGVFSSLSRLEVFERDAFVALKDSVLLSGFPRARVDVLQGSELAANFAAFHITPPARPAATWKAATGPGETVQVGLPSAAESFDLSGMSGGGLWRVGPSSEGGACPVTLVATHSQSLTNPGGSPERFSQSTMIGHHLRLLIDDYEDLREEILTRWPELQRAPWNLDA